MAVPTMTNTRSVNLEVVNREVQELFSQAGTIASLIKGSEKTQKISNYLWRHPLKTRQGGTTAKVSGDGGSTAGALPPGTGANFTHLTGAYFYSARMVRVTREQRDTSGSNDQATVDVWADAMANLTVGALVEQDIELHQPGTGVLTAGASTASAANPSTMTFAGATDYLGVNRLWEGMAVDIYASNLSTKRTYTAPLIIVSIDYDAKTVTFDQQVSDVVATDVITVMGLTAYGPTTLTTGSSTFPQTGQAGGISGDSYRHGIPYWTDTTAYAYFYGLQKSTVPQVQGNRVSAAGNPLDFDHVHRLIAKVQRRRGKDVWRGCIGIADMAQRANVFNLSTAITTKLITGSTMGRAVDQMPDNIGIEDTFDMAGIPVHISPRADRSEIHFIVPNMIYKGELFPTQMTELGGRTVFEGRNSSGQLVTYEEFGLMSAYDYVVPDAGAFGKIEDIKLPDAWDA